MLMNGRRTPSGNGQEVETGLVFLNILEVDKPIVTGAGETDASITDGATQGCCGGASEVMDSCSVCIV